MKVGPSWQTPQRIRTSRMNQPLVYIQRTLVGAKSYLPFKSQRQLDVFTKFTHLYFLITPNEPIYLSKRGHRGPLRGPETFPGPIYSLLHWSSRLLHPSLFPIFAHFEFSQLLRRASARKTIRGIRVQQTKLHRIVNPPPANHIWVHL